MTTFLTGCTHFGHANIIKLANRPFKDVDEMDGTLVRNWNRVVGPNDTVIHLGDFAYKNESDRNVINRLNGRLVLIQGNHDIGHWGIPYLEIEHDKRKIVLFHYPIEEWNGWYGGSIHFHCHTHSKEFVSGVRRGNVGADACNFTPIALEQAVARFPKP